VYQRTVLPALFTPPFSQFSTLLHLFQYHTQAGAVCDSSPKRKGEVLHFVFRKVHVVSLFALLLCLFTTHKGVKDTLLFTNAHIKHFSAVYIIFILDFAGIAVSIYSQQSCG
jgi:hypothetical protein